MCAQLVVALVVETFDCCVFDRAVHAFDLAVCPRMIWLGKPVLYAVRLTDHVEAYWPGIGSALAGNRLYCGSAAALRTGYRYR